MPDWLSLLLTNLGTATGVSALAVAYIRIINARHKTRMEETDSDRKSRKEDRDSEIDVLHRIIDELRQEREQVKQELAEFRGHVESTNQLRDEEVKKLKDEHTACKVALGEMKQIEKFVRQDRDGLRRQLDLLDREVRQLREVVGDNGKNPAGG